MKVLGPFAWLTAPTFPNLPPSVVASTVRKKRKMSRRRTSRTAATKVIRFTATRLSTGSVKAWSKAATTAAWIWGNDFQEFWEDFCLDAEKIGRKINLQHLCFLFFWCAVGSCVHFQEWMKTYEVALGRHAIFREKGNQTRKTTSKQEQGSKLSSTATHLTNPSSQCSNAGLPSHMAQHSLSGHQLPSPFLTLARSPWPKG